MLLFLLIRNQKKKVGFVLGQGKMRLYYKLLNPTIREGWGHASEDVSSCPTYEQMCTCCVARVDSSSSSYNLLFMCSVAACLVIVFGT